MYYVSVYESINSIVAGDNTCPDGRWKCSSGNFKCIDTDWVCDGYNDCENAEDESQDTCSK